MKEKIAKLGTSPIRSGRDQPSGWIKMTRGPASCGLCDLWRLKETYHLWWVYGNKTNKDSISFIRFQAHPHRYNKPVKFNTFASKNFTEIFIQGRNFTEIRIADQSELLNIHSEQEVHLTFTSSHSTSLILSRFRANQLEKIFVACARELHCAPRQVQLALFFHYGTSSDLELSMAIFVFIQISF